jgi:hypothetical protein
VRALDLRDGPVDGVLDQLLMALAAGQRAIDLRDDAALGVEAVGIDRTDGADTARRGPRAGTGMIGCDDALAAFDLRTLLTAEV